MNAIEFFLLAAGYFAFLVVSIRFMMKALKEEGGDFELFLERVKQQRNIKAYAELQLVSKRMKSRLPSQHGLKFRGRAQSYRHMGLIEDFSPHRYFQAKNDPDIWNLALKRGGGVWRFRRVDPDNFKFTPAREGEVRASIDLDYSPE